MSAQAAPPREASIWHDVECGAFAADLPVWRDLAARAGGAILELGCGTGRVALDLGRQGHEVVAIDRDAELLEVLTERLLDEGLPVTAACADAAALELGREFSLVIAPMQLFQVLGGRTARQHVLGAMRRHLAPGGLAAAAVIAGSQAPRPGTGSAGPSVPDIREVDGWVYSSLPVAVHADGHVIEATRLRQRVSPSGDLGEESHVDRLERIEVGELHADALEAGLQRAGQRRVAVDDAYIGSTILLWSPR